MAQQFEFFVAQRYLRARRKETVISVITVISILGVAAGTMSLIVATAITNGFRITLQRSLLGATAHVTVVEKTPGFGIEDWQSLIGRLRSLPGVTDAEPSLYGTVYLSGPLQSDGAVLKGILTESATPTQEMLAKLKEGTFADLRRSEAIPGIILGNQLAARTGMKLGAVVKVISPQGELTPFGPRPSFHLFRVVGIFESGFFDLDTGWAFARLEDVQRTLALTNVVNAIELRLADIHRAPAVAEAARQATGGKLEAKTWMEQNKQLLTALQMDKVVTVVVIGLIQLVAGLNILITLVMLVMEKYRDIAIIMSMGASRQQVRRVFVLQGVIIGAIGTALGLTLGYTLSYLADRFRWIQLDPEIYILSHVPFEPRLLDGVFVAAAALLISYLATIYPARNAAAIAPAEALRYE